MSKTELPDLIRIVLENADYALTKDQLHQRVSDGFGYEVSERTLESQLRELYENDELIRFKDSDGTRGQPPYCYEIQQEGTTDENGGHEETSGTRYVG